MSLWRYSPLPRPLVLAGRLYSGRPVRVFDLFALAEVAAAGTPDPAEDLGDDPTPEDLRAAYEGASSWPPDWPAGLAFEPGAVVVLGSVLRDHALDEAALAELAGRLTLAEWAAVRDCAWRPTPFDRATAALDRHLGVSAIETEEGVPWAQAIAEVCESLGLALDQVLPMTLPEIRLHRQNGQATCEDSPASAEGERKRVKFWFPDRAAAEAPTPSAPKG